MDHQKSRILVVDDEIIIAMNLQKILRNNGYDIPAISSSGEDALKKVKEHNPDLVFMDIRLGQRMDGIEAAQIIRAQFGIPVVFLTAYADVETLERAKALDPYGYLIKPISERDLMIVTEFAIHRKKIDHLLSLKNKQQETIAEIGQLGLGSMNLDDFFNQVTQKVSQTLHVKYSKLLKVLPNRKGLLLLAGTGWHTGLVGQKIIPLGLKSQAGFTLAANQSVIIDDLTLENRFKDTHFLKPHAIISSLSTVIRGTSSPFGVLSAHTTVKRYFTANDVNFLQAVATILSQVIQRQQAFTELETRVTERTLELSNRTEELFITNNQLKKSLHYRDQFLSLASHELKTPLTALGLQLQITQRRIVPNENQGPSREALQHSMRASLCHVATLSRLIDDLLDISQIQSDRLILNYVEMNLETVLREIIESFSEHLNLANCKITVTLEKSVIVYWDRCRFEQVIYNLLSNLVKYAPNSIASFSIQKKQNTVILIVADNGPGIAQEAHDKIFECFERATPDPNIAGLGIGLFIVKRIIEAHRGTVQLDHSSKPTKFIIELPINPTTMVQTGTTGWANGVDYGVEKHSFNRR